jgi:hypothetical protein
MISLVKEAFAEIERLPDEEQQAVAEWILAELASERR